MSAPCLTPCSPRRLLSALTFVGLIAALPAQSWTRVYDAQNAVIAIVDPVTGTWWGDSAGCNFPSPGICPTWFESIAYADQLATGTYADWRVPSKDEFVKAVADGAYAELVAAFPNSAWGSSFWTSTTKGTEERQPAAGVRRAGGALLQGATREVDRRAIVRGELAVEGAHHLHDTLPARSAVDEDRASGVLRR
jgi:hypothetical protein